MIIGFIIAFSVTLIVFIPFTTRLRFYISDRNFAFSFSVKIGLLPPEYIFAARAGEVLSSKSGDEYQLGPIEADMGLTLKDMKELMRFIPLTYAHALICFGDKNNAMRTAIILKCADMFMAALERKLPFPKGRMKRVIIPAYTQNKLFIDSEIKFSVTLFVIFLALFKILKNRGKNNEHK
ncbi:MAG: hypothetical protein ACOYIQ_02745 [Christensenellales bacterium]|jgi:hypothetical protein